jgi:diguanylate cyclase
MARTDDLTGLPNRRAWDEELPREVLRSRRETLPLCVAMIDLDHFKEYNDEHGHQAGDRLLKQAAAAWGVELRGTDFLARYGGEEFALALPACPPDEAIAVVERLRAATPQGETASAGIACWNGAESAAALVGRADAALYEAKRQGRNLSLLA